MFFGEYTPLLSQQLLQRRLANGKARIDPEVGLEKYCTHCGEYWPQDTLFWTPLASRPDGLQDWCKACRSEEASAAHRAKKAA
ncbi:hypothetical protein [Vibrio gazogenes]|uniref:Uncharacterized protein n=1 Tax=Vibrio gazogenes DSM 21264 = NBRC 103151 TaxID=1123492 RepID=A0A1M5F7Q0_VIBGA|nr:hypothetical protein [Vibrio gazogenes]USP15446.1 hypothetical protein MKS89_18785 [Vibrio gazogenes]SHF87640.1 hypothetical protein SAMN02745781_03385 [Vibrio gazogenes DSM 21264] [Vibrio gazogenes DSM 21264 = NBRC 103151]SJN54511.1 hypothetical protein BQ6471_01048 [Vibrio gazogenes]HEG4440067.1 hypothetical protein [Vibrio cholerae]